VVHVAKNLKHFSDKIADLQGAPHLGVCMFRLFSCLIYLCGTKKIRYEYMRVVQASNIGVSTTPDVCSCGNVGTCGYACSFLMLVLR